MPREQLPQLEVHVWLARPEQITSNELLRDYEGLLDAEETALRSRLRFEADRHRYLVAHALLRTTLSAYADVDPRDWRFSRNAFGRPEPMPSHQGRLRFNLSRTTGLIACAVTRDADLGIDVEDLHRMDDPMEVARHAFAPSEVADLEARGGDDRRLRFFEYWTAKEAWLKGRGVGLSEPLNRAVFRFGGAGTEPQLLDESGGVNQAWQVCVSRPTDQHVMAVAVRREAHQRFDVFERWTTPLGR